MNFFSKGNLLFSYGNLSSSPFKENEFLAFLEFTEESTSEWLPHLSFTAGMSQTLSQTLRL